MHGRVQYGLLLRHVRPSGRMLRIHELLRLLRPRSKGAEAYWFVQRVRQCEEAAQPSVVWLLFLIVSCVAVGPGWDTARQTDCNDHCDHRTR